MIDSKITEMLIEQLRHTSFVDEGFLVLIREVIVSPLRVAMRG
jgi:hypothetical protein